MDALGEFAFSWGLPVTFIIRRFKDDDYSEIASWWDACGENRPEPGMMVEDGTFVVEERGLPVMTMTVLLTQSKALAMFEGFIAKPGMETLDRRELGHSLWDHCFAYAKSKGYRNVICYGKPELAKRYENFGMRAAMSELVGMMRRI